MTVPGSGRSSRAPTTLSLGRRAALRVGTTLALADRTFGSKPASSLWLKRSSPRATLVHEQTDP